MRIAVMVNGSSDTHVQRREIREVQEDLIKRIVAPLGFRVDESSPYADARLPDGSRVQTRFLRNPFCQPPS